MNRSPLNDAGDSPDASRLPGTPEAGDGNAHSARASELIRRLGLQPHPEGGFYSEVFRSAHAVTPADGRPSEAR